MGVIVLPNTEEEAVIFLQENGVFPKERKCPVSWDHDMELLLTEEGIFWKCGFPFCIGPRLSVKSGTWFRYCNIPLVKALRFLYNWSLELTSVKWCTEQVGINASTISCWKRRIRELIAEDLDRIPCRKIGGEGLTVEVDETVFGRNRRTATKLSGRQWVVGGICIETGQCFLKMAPDRSAGAFLDAIRDNVAEGSTIYSDRSKQYRTSEFEAAGIKELEAGHRFKFVEPATGENTKAMDAIWSSFKWRNKRQLACASQLLDSYLNEFIWRQEIGDTDPFHALLEAIKRSPMNNEDKSERSSPALPKQEDLGIHLLEVPGSSTEIVEQPKNAKGIPVEVCPACDMGFENVADLLMHVSEVHEFCGTVKQEVFPNYAAFWRWKEEMEKEYSTHWARRGERLVNKVFHAHLRCRWSRRIVSHKRKIIEKSCTSFMNVRRYLSNDVTNVDYCVDHFGHKQGHTQHPPLPWSVKVEIAEMLKIGLAAADIVRVFELENREGLREEHAVTLRTVKSIEAKLKVDREMFKKDGCVNPEVRRSKSESISDECSMFAEFYEEEPGSTPDFHIKAEPIPDESFMTEAFIEEEPSSSTTTTLKAEPVPGERSVAETSIKEEPVSSITLAIKAEPVANEGSMTNGKTFFKEEPSSSTRLTFETQPALDGSPMFDNSIKEEPTSVTTSFAEPSTMVELSSVESKPMYGDEFPGFTLTVAPDGKGFAVVKESPCIVGPLEIL